MQIAEDNLSLLSKDILALTSKVNISQIEILQRNLKVPTNCSIFLGNMIPGITQPQDKGLGIERFLQGEYTFTFAWDKFGLFCLVVWTLSSRNFIHKGMENLFWNPRNTKCLSLRCHTTPQSRPQRELMGSKLDENIWGVCASGL